MNRITYLTFMVLFALLLAACGEAEPGIPVTGQESDLQLQVEAPDGESALRQADGAITFNYVVTNTGPQSLRGPVIVNDAPRQVSCPPLSTVGDLDDELDFNESITCTAFYTPGEAERNSGSVTSRAQAIVGGMASNESTLTLGQAAGTPTGISEGAAHTPEASPTPLAFPTDSSRTAAAPSETPQVFPTATLLVNSTATQDPSANPTGTPLDIPTATVISSGNPTQLPTASADSVNVIDLPAGSDMILLPGVVPAGERIRYSIDAVQGQQLSLNFIVRTDQLFLSVTGPDGSSIKAPETAMPWSEALSSAGDYLIEIVNVDSSAVQPYVLELHLSPAN
jgi:hypothetical protein